MKKTHLKLAEKEIIICSKCKSKMNFSYKIWRDSIKFICPKCGYSYEEFLSELGGM